MIPTFDEEFVGEGVTCSKVGSSDFEADEGVMLDDKEN